MESWERPSQAPKQLLSLLALFLCHTRLLHLRWYECAGLSLPRPGQAQKKSSVNSPWQSSAKHAAKLSPAFVFNFLAWRAAEGVANSQMQS